MGLLECPDCRRAVSDLATNCPKCGYPINQLKEELRRVRFPARWPSIVTIILCTFFNCLMFFTMWLIVLVEHDVDKVEESVETAILPLSIGLKLIVFQIFLSIYWLILTFRRTIEWKWWYHALPYLIFLIAVITWRIIVWR